MITVSAAQDFTAGKLAVALAYAVGSGGVLYLLMLGGRRLVDRVKPARAFVQTATGVVMVLVAVAMTADLDLKFQNAIADDLPSVLVNPSGELEKSGAVSDALADVRGGHGAQEGGAAEAAAGEKLPDYGAAPDFTNTQQWFNTPRRQAALDRAADQGRGQGGADRLLDLHLHQLHPHPAFVKSWDERYRDQGLTVVGVHSPEFAFEKDAATSRARSPTRGSATRWCRTTSSAPGTRLRISTGRRST